MPSPTVSATLAAVKRGAILHTAARQRHERIEQFWWTTAVADIQQIRELCRVTRDPTREGHDAIAIRTDAFEGDGVALNAAVFDFTWYLLDVRAPVHGAG